MREIATTLCCETQWSLEVRERVGNAVLRVLCETQIWGPTWINFQWQGNMTKMCMALCPRFEFMPTYIQTRNKGTQYSRKKIIYISSFKFYLKKYIMIIMVVFFVPILIVFGRLPDDIPRPFFWKAWAPKDGHPTSA